MKWVWKNCVMRDRSIQRDWMNLAWTWISGNFWSWFVRKTWVKAGFRGPLGVFLCMLYKFYLRTTCLSVNYRIETTIHTKFDGHYLKEYNSSSWWGTRNRKNDSYSDRLFAVAYFLVEGFSDMKCSSNTPARISLVSSSIECADKDWEFVRKPLSSRRTLEGIFRENTGIVKNVADDDFVYRKAIYDNDK